MKEEKGKRRRIFFLFVVFLFFFSLKLISLQEIEVGSSILYFQRFFLHPMKARINYNSKSIGDMDTSEHDLAGNKIQFPSHVPTSLTAHLSLLYFVLFLSLSYFLLLFLSLFSSFSFFLSSSLCLFSILKFFLLFNFSFRTNHPSSDHVQRGGCFYQHPWQIYKRKLKVKKEK